MVQPSNVRLVTEAALAAALAAIGQPAPSPAEPTPVGNGGTPDVPYTPPSGAVVIGSTPLGTSSTTFATAVAPVAKPARMSAFSAPMPTNAWWTNLFMGDNQVAPLPYTMRPTAAGMDICYPQNKIAKETYVITVFLPNISLNAVETLQARTIVDYDDLSATLRWPTASANKLQMCIAQGMGLVTMQYTNLTPKILTTGSAVIEINGAAPGGNVTGTKFKVVLNSGQTWMIYASSSITLGTTTSAGFTASAPFTGTIQVSLLPSGNTAAEAILDGAAGRYATGGVVTMAANAGLGDINYSYETAGTTGTLLTYALPHHIDSIYSGLQANIQLGSMKGTMQGMSGTTWTCRETLPTITFAPPRPLDSARVSAVTSAVTNDINSAYAMITDDPYFSGKYLARWARLAQIADELGLTTLAATARGKYKPDLIKWLDGTNGNRLRYDTTWRGIISTNGITSTQADFGNGIYNDHQFHYGYHVYAAAVLAKTDSAFVTSHGSKVMELIRDYANTTNADTYATKFRAKDLYSGHSWAQGLDNTADPKNQESTSESINGYYAMHLWGVITGNDQCALAGQILLAQEIRTAKKYWHVKSSDTIYPAPFNQQKVVGILWGSKVDYATFFGGQAEFVHGIQMLPYTPVTELYLTSDWVTEEYPVVRAAAFDRTYPVSAVLLSGGSGYVGQFTSPTGQQYSNYILATGGTGNGLNFNVNITGGVVTEVFVCTDAHGQGYTEGDIVNINGSGGSGCTVRLVVKPPSGWAGILYGDHAVIDKAAAWEELNAIGASVPNWDDGNSKANMLHWVASRP